MKGGYLTMTMKRMNFYLADMQIKRLKSLQKKTGLPLSDILRRAIDDYWEKYERKARYQNNDNERR
jgi:predicted DNA-binding protein